jgi:hypothetical protein
MTQVKSHRTVRYFFIIICNTGTGYQFKERHLTFVSNKEFSFFHLNEEMPMSDWSRKLKANLHGSECNEKEPIMMVMIRIQKCDPATLLN